MKENGKQREADKEDKIKTGPCDISPVVHREETPPLCVTEEAIDRERDDEDSQQRCQEGELSRRRCKTLVHVKTPFLKVVHHFSQDKVRHKVLGIIKKDKKGRGSIKEVVQYKNETRTKFA